MAQQTVQLTGRAGVSLSGLAVAADAALSDKWANTGVELVYINNGGGSSITVTLNWGTGSTVDGQTPTARTVTIPAGANKVIGPFPTSNYNDAQNNASVTYSAVATVTICVFKNGT